MVRVALLHGGHRAAALFVVAFLVFFGRRLHCAGARSGSRWSRLGSRLLRVLILRRERGCPGESQC